MAIALASLVAAPPSGRGTAVIIDHQQYAQAVILRGQQVPWADPVAYAQFLGQAQGLLKPDATLLDLGTWYANALTTDDALRSSLSARSRTGFALKTLLADESSAGAALAASDDEVAATVDAYLTAHPDAAARWTDLRVVEADAADGRTVHLMLGAVVRPAWAAWVLAPFTDGIAIEASSSARAW